MQKGPSSGPFRLLRCRNDPAGAAYFFFAAGFFGAGFFAAGFSWWLKARLPGWLRLTD
jgi:hypothetical protein